METTKEYRVILTCKTQQVKVIKANSAKEAIDIASEDDWREKEEIIESSVDAYLNDFNPTK